MNPPIPAADLGIAVAPHEEFLPSAGFLHPLLRGGVLAKEDVPSRCVVDEVVHALRATQAADDAGGFEDVQVCMGNPTLREPPGEGRL